VSIRHSAGPRRGPRNDQGREHGGKPNVNDSHFERTAEQIGRAWVITDQLVSDSLGMGVRPSGATLEGPRGGTVTQGLGPARGNAARTAASGGLSAGRSAITFATSSKGFGIGKPRVVRAALRNGRRPNWSRNGEFQVKGNGVFIGRWMVSHRSSADQPLPVRPNRTQDRSEPGGYRCQPEDDPQAAPISRLSQGTGVGHHLPGCRPRKAWLSASSERPPPWRPPPCSSRPLAAGKRPLCRTGGRSRRRWGIKPPRGPTAGSCGGVVTNMGNGEWGRGAPQPGDRPGECGPWSARR